MKTFVLGVLLIFLVVGCTARQAPENDQVCVKEGTGEKLSLNEAKSIASNSECSQGALKEKYICNEITGTWWIDLDIEKEGCSPACVVNVATKEAEINWRCTGLIMPEEEP